jgi:hypothetical protein
MWCLGIDGVVYVVCGGAEQPAPGLAAARRAAVSARGDHGGLVVTWAVSVEIVAPGSEEWGSVALALAAKRLNASGPAATLVETWAANSTVIRLTPLDDEVLPPSADSGAATPRPTPAATPIRLGEPASATLAGP